MDARLKSIVDRIERLDEEQRGIGSDKADIYKEAKSAGYSPKLLRRLIRERRRDAAEVEAEEAELSAYKAAIGMAVELVRDQGVSLREAARRTGTTKSSIHRALSVPEENEAARDTPPAASPPPDFDRDVGPIPEFLRSAP